MKILIIFIMVTITTVHADMVKKSEVELKCEKGIQLISNKNTAQILINGQIVHEDENTYAVTEGGDPYMQFIGGGFNITLRGEQFTKAFSTWGEWVRINESVYVNHFIRNKQYEAQCEGKVKFSSAF